jgi:hypothetical protein
MDTCTFEEACSQDQPTSKTVQERDQCADPSSIHRVPFSRRRPECIPDSCPSQRQSYASRDHRRPTTRNYLAISILPLVGANHQKIFDSRIHCVHGDLLVSASDPGRNDIQHRLPRQGGPFSPLDHPLTENHPRSHIWSSSRSGVIPPHVRCPVYNASMRETSRRPNGIPHRALRAELLLRLPSRASVPRHYPHVRCFRSHNVHYQRSALRS